MEVQKQCDDTTNNIIIIIIIIIIEQWAFLLFMPHDFQDLRILKSLGFEDPKISKILESSITNHHHNQDLYENPENSMLKTYQGKIWRSTDTQMIKM